MNRPAKWLTVCMGGTLLAAAFLFGCERDTCQNAQASLELAIQRAKTRAVTTPWPLIT
jgi:hypothetical protein